MNAEYLFGIFYVIMGTVMFMSRWMKIIGIVCLLLCGCAKKDLVTIKSEQLMKQTSYLQTSAYVHVEVNLMEISDEVYRYHVVFNQPNVNIDDFKALVITDDATQTTIPSIGLYDNDKCNLYIDKIDRENNYYEGVSLMGLTTQNQVRCLIYLSGVVDGETFEEYLCLEESLYDAS